MLVLHRFPETFHKHIIPPGALAIHADSNIVVFQELSEGKAGELAALIGIHDLGLAVFIDRFLERIQTKTGIHGDRDPMRQDASLLNCV